MYREVLIFNPQNDLALATGGINYVAPPFALQMAADLAVLPAFIAEPGSLLITDSDLDAEWLEHLNATLGLNIHAVKRNQLRHLSDYRIIPWGWCLDIRRRLIKWGANRDSVPSKDEIYYLRGLSHRRVSTLIHMRLQELLGRQLCSAPVELATTGEVMAFVEKHRQCYIKTPWSSSGRGIYHTTDGTSPELEQWCRGALKRQGSLLCEIAFNKTMDFAVEYHCSDGKATVRGYSLFDTDSHSQYSHGEVASSEVLKQRITKQCPILDNVVIALTQVLDELVAAHYTGWLGVDMLLFKNAQRTMHIAQSGTNAKSAGLPPHLSSLQSPLNTGLNPCVELNLRTTMGAITSVLGDRVLAPATTGTFTIEQRSSTSIPWRELQEPVFEKGRLSSGALCLTTPSPTALYRAVLWTNQQSELTTI